MIQRLPGTMQGFARRRIAGADRSRVRLLAASVTCFAVLAAAPRMLFAAGLNVRVLDPQGRGVPGMVVMAEPDDHRLDKRLPRTVVMDQRNIQFVPDVIVIQTGSSVDFPNSDQILHQVYSFSPAKTFQLSLYAGHHYPPVLFDRPGLVVVGCNIHDQMIGYIYVTDSPYFGRTDQTGTLQLHDLPAGRYTVKAWLPRLEGADRDGVQTVVSLAADAVGEVHLSLTHAPRKAPPMMMDKRWADY